jgi:hypothetical protein
MFVSMRPCVNACTRGKKLSFSRGCAFSRRSPMTAISDCAS